MTIGQRIAQRRKALGLSQEQLGAQLGVSRQAIYKWESDAALPEIEKLVTLSRRFSVSVGWLLGEETDAPEGADADTPADDEGELTEAQLRMVEELVRRYQAAQPKRRRWPAVLGCVLACALLLYLFGQLRSVRQDYQNLQQALNNVNYSVGSQIGTISDQVRSLLEQQVNITLSESTDIASVDYAAGTVTFSLSAAPKTYVDGMTAVFTVDCGEEIVSAEGTLGENQCYTASVTCPLTDDEISILAAFVQGDTRQYQLIGQYTGLYSASFPRYDLYDAPLLFAIDTMSGLLRKGEQFSVTRWIDEDSLTPSEPAQLRMGLFRDQKLVMWLDPNTDANTDAKDSSFFRTPRAVTLEAGHIYTLALVVTDVYGRECVCPGNAVCYDEWMKQWEHADSSTVSATPGSASPADWTY